MPLAICDRCGFEYHLSELRKEWTGLMVCDADYDPKPRDLSRPNLRPEGLPLRNARPEPAPIWVAPDAYLYGAITAGGNVSAALVVGPGAGYRPLGGTIAGAGNLSGVIAKSTTLASAMVGVGALTAAMRVAVSLTGSITNSNILTGTFDRANTLGGAVIGTGALTGSVLVRVGLAGAVAGTSAYSGSLSVIAGFMGSISGVGTLAGTMAIAVRLSGSVVGAGATSGSMTNTPAGGGGTLWTPEANGVGLLAVMDPKTTSTITYDSGTMKVSAYASKIGNAVFAQSGNAMMTYSPTAVNGNPALTASTFAFMVASQIKAGPAPRFVAGVAIVADTTRTSSIWSGGGANFQFRGSPNGVLTLNSQSAQAILDTPNNAITAGQPFIYVAWVSGTDAGIRVNGTLAASRTTSISLNGNPESVVMSASGENGLGAWAGASYGGAVPSLREMQRYEAYYAWANGLQGLLPADHPDKAAPPTVPA